MFIEDLISTYLKYEKDENIKNEILNLRPQEKEELFGKRLEFGTAGLRGAVGFGFARMNALVIIQTTQGIFEYLCEIHGLEKVQKRGVVVGHDHRYGSIQFAELVAAVFLSRNVKVEYYRDICHTPLVPFGVCRLDAVCGIMITASHNPKQDNGYKLYGSNGCQIIPPHDSKIAALILQNLEPWSESVWDQEACLRLKDSLCPDSSELMLNEYYASILSNLRLSADLKQMNVQVCYTAMHGVGLLFAKRMVHELRLESMVIVQEQASPDPEFPTVSFPNPEEKVHYHVQLLTTRDRLCLP